MKLLLMCGAFVCLSLPQVKAQSSGDITINTGGTLSCTTVKGESGFNALTWSIGGAEAVTINAGAGSGIGKPILAELVASRSLDACSEQLIKTFVVGRAIPTVVLTQYSGGEKPFAFIVVTLSHVFLTSYEISGAVRQQPTEILKFAYQQVCVQTTGQNSDGSHQMPVKVCYNTATNIVT